jgi:hypothetical protein
MKWRLREQYRKSMKQRVGSLINKTNKTLAKLIKRRREKNLMKLEMKKRISQQISIKSKEL